MKKFFRSKYIIVYVLLLAGIYGFSLTIQIFWHPPVLMYHSLSPKTGLSKTVVHPSQFERQMIFLKNKNYHVISLEELFSRIKNNQRIPFKTIVLTFDDGYEDNYHYAFPILKKLGFPATVFLVTEWIGKPGYLKWVQIKEMEEQGIRFGNHTQTHAYLPSLGMREIQKEVDTSQKVLATTLKNPSSIFCYPFGAYSISIQNLIQQKRYEAALATSADGLSPLNDVYAFRRVRISDSSDNLFVFWVETSGYYSFIRQLQKKIKRIRKHYG